MTIAYFPGNVVYCTNPEEINEVCLALWKSASASGGLVIGFDTEWPYYQGQTSLVQLCPSDQMTCYIFYVFHLEKLPVHLEILLKCKEVQFTGIALKQDIMRLSYTFMLNLDSTNKNKWIELDALAKSTGLRPKRGNMWGLSSLSESLLGLEVIKDQTFSDWSTKYLTPKQLRYAATDAYVSLLCYDVLKLTTNLTPRTTCVPRTSHPVLESESNLCSGRDSYKSSGPKREDTESSMLKNALLLAASAVALVWLLWRS